MTLRHIFGPDGTPALTDHRRHLVDGQSCEKCRGSDNLRR